LLFNDTFYIMDSETSPERGYADLTMIVRPDMRQYPLLDFLMEFKYASLKDLEMSGEKLRRMSNDGLKALPAVRQKICRIGNKIKRLS
jgi:hypothetical protein